MTSELHSGSVNSRTRRLQAHAKRKSASDSEALANDLPDTATLQECRQKVSPRPSTDEPPSEVRFKRLGG